MPQPDINLTAAIDPSSIAGIRKTIASGVQDVTISASDRSIASISKRISNSNPVISLSADPKSVLNVSSAVQKGVNDVKADIGVQTSSLKNIHDLVQNSVSNIKLDIRAEDIRGISKILSSVNKNIGSVTKSIEKMAATSEAKIPQMISRIEQLNSKLEETKKAMSDIKLPSQRVVAQATAQSQVTEQSRRTKATISNEQVAKNIIERPFRLRDVELEKDLIANRASTSELTKYLKSINFTDREDFKRSVDELDDKLKERVRKAISAASRDRQEEIFRKTGIDYRDQKSKKFNFDVIQGGTGISDSDRTRSTLDNLFDERSRFRSSSGGNGGGRPPRPTSRDIPDDDGGRSERRTSALSKEVDLISRAAVGQDNLTKSIQGSSEAINSFSDRVALTTKRLGAYFVAAGAFFQISRGVGAATQGVVELDREQNKLNQILSQGSDAASKTADKVLELAEKYGQAGAEMLKATNVLAQAGDKFQGDALITTLEGLTRTTVAATFGTIEETTSGLIAALNQFNLTGEDTLRILDIANKLSKDFAAESGDIFKATERGGSTFKVAGGNFEQFAAVVTAARSLTRLSAETIGTAINTLSVRSLRKDIVAFEEEITRSVGGIRDASGNLLPLVDRWRQIAKATESYNNEELSAVVEKLSDIRQAKVLQPLIQDLKRGADASQLIKALEAARNSAGSLSQDTEIGLQRIDLQLRSVGTEFEKVFKGLAEDQDIKQLVSEFATLAKAVANVLDLLTPFAGTLIRLGAIKLTFSALSSLPKIVSGLRQLTNNADDAVSAINSVIDASNRSSSVRIQPTNIAPSFRTTANTNSISSRSSDARKSALKPRYNYVKESRPEFITTSIALASNRLGDIVGNKFSSEERSNLSRIIDDLTQANLTKQSESGEITRALQDAVYFRAKEMDVEKRSRSKFPSVRQQQRERAVSKLADQPPSQGSLNRAVKDASKKLVDDVTVSALEKAAIQSKNYIDSLSSFDESKVSAVFVTQPKTQQFDFKSGRDAFLNFGLFGSNTPPSDPEKPKKATIPPRTSDRFYNFTNIPEEIKRYNVTKPVKRTTPGLLDFSQNELDKSFGAIPTLYKTIQGFSDSIRSKVDKYRSVIQNLQKNPNIFDTRIDSIISKTSASINDYFYNVAERSYKSVQQFSRNTSNKLLTNFKTTSLNLAFNTFDASMYVADLSNKIGTSISGFFKGLGGDIVDVFSSARKEARTLYNNFNSNLLRNQNRFSIIDRSESSPISRIVESKVTSKPIKEEITLRPITPEIQKEIEENQRSIKLKQSERNFAFNTAIEKSSASKTEDLGPSPDEVRAKILALESLKKQANANIKEADSKLYSSTATVDQVSKTNRTIQKNVEAVNSLTQKQLELVALMEKQKSVYRKGQIISPFAQEKNSNLRLLEYGIGNISKEIADKQREQASIRKRISSIESSTASDLATQTEYKELKLKLDQNQKALDLLTKEQLNLAGKYRSEQSRRIDVPIDEVDRKASLRDRFNTFRNSTTGRVAGVTAAVATPMLASFGIDAINNRYAQQIEELSNVRSTDLEKSRELVDRRANLERRSSTIGGIGSGVQLGGIIGAVVGSAVPVVGTIVGGVVGSSLGAAVGSIVGLTNAASKSEIAIKEFGISLSQVDFSKTPQDFGKLLNEQLREVAGRGEITAFQALSDKVFGRESAREKISNFITGSSDSATITSDAIRGIFTSSIKDVIESNRNASDTIFLENLEDAVFKKLTGSGVDKNFAKQLVAIIGESLTKQVIETKNEILNADRDTASILSKTTDTFYQAAIRMADATRKLKTENDKAALSLENTRKAFRAISGERAEIPLIPENSSQMIVDRLTDLAQNLPQSGRFRQAGIRSAIRRETGSALSESEQTILADSIQLQSFAKNLSTQALQRVAGREFTEQNLVNAGPKLEQFLEKLFAESNLKNNLETEAGRSQLEDFRLFVTRQARENVTSFNANPLDFISKAAGQFADLSPVVARLTETFKSINIRIQEQSEIYDRLQFAQDLFYKSQNSIISRSISIARQGREITPNVQNVISDLTRVINSSQLVGRNPNGRLDTGILQAAQERAVAERNFALLTQGTTPDKQNQDEIARSYAVLIDKQAAYTNAVARSDLALQAFRGRLEATADALKRISDTQKNLGSKTTTEVDRSFFDLQNFRQLTANLFKKLQELGIDTPEEFATVPLDFIRREAPGLVNAVGTKFFQDALAGASEFSGFNIDGLNASVGEIVDATRLFAGQVQTSRLPGLVQNNTRQNNLANSAMYDFNAIRDIENQQLQGINKINENIIRSTQEMIRSLGVNTLASQEALIRLSSLLPSVEQDQRSGVRPTTNFPAIPQSPSVSTNNNSNVPEESTREFKNNLGINANTPLSNSELTRVSTLLSSIENSSKSIYSSNLDSLRAILSIGKDVSSLVLLNINSSKDSSGFNNSIFEIVQEGKATRAAIEKRMVELNINPSGSTSTNTIDTNRSIIPSSTTSQPSTRTIERTEQSSQTGNKELEKLTSVMSSLIVEMDSLKKTVSDNKSAEKLESITNKFTESLKNIKIDSNIKIGGDFNITGFDSVGRDQTTRIIITRVMQNFIDQLDGSVPAEASLASKLRVALKQINS